MPQEIITEHYSQSFSEMDTMTNSKNTLWGEKTQLLFNLILIKNNFFFYSIYTDFFSKKKRVVFNQSTT